MAIRCLIVDDTDHFRRAAQAMLERGDIDVVGVASTSADALARAGELRPDVALVNINLGEESGFDLARRFAESAPRMDVILMSTYSDAEVSDAVAAAGCLGYLSKNDLSGAAVRRLLEGWR